MSVDLKNLFITPTWPAPPHIKAFSSLRVSGVGGEAAIDHVQLKKILNLPGDTIRIKQVHGATVIKALAENNLAEADAVFTDTPATVCLVQTADCLPVFITNRLGTHVAVAHAGWKGLSQGVIEATVAQLNLPAVDLLVWLGPAIGPDKFEVRKDVYDAFTLNHPDAVNAFRKISDDQWVANLYELARLRLHKIGIKEIYGGEYCTHSDEKRFFSYRRDGKLLGRMVNLIWITEKNPNL